MTTIAMESQRLRALHHAQEVRMAHAHEKVRLRALTPAERSRQVQAVLRAECLPEVYAGMRVAHVLGCLKKIGPWKIEWMLGRVRVSSGDRKLRELTLRQRRLLADLLGAGRS